MLRNQNQKNRGNNIVRGKGFPSSGNQTSKDEDEGSSIQPSQIGGFIGVGGRGRHREVKCYACGEIGHMSWNFPRIRLQIREM